MTNTALKAGEFKSIKPGASIPLVNKSLDQPVKVVRMEHEYGFNRFVMVELQDECKTRILVLPEDLCQ